MDNLFKKTVQCSVCDNSFESAKVRRSKVAVKSIDTDFFTVYRGDNPLFYLVYICPHCGFGFTENFKKPTEEMQEAFLKLLSPLPGDYSGHRTLEMGIQAYERALECAHLLNTKNQVLAGLTLHLTWFYREAGNSEKENEYLQKALDYFTAAYEREVESGTLAKTLYLMGELSRRLGDERRAVQCFGRIIGDQTIRDAGIIRMARERWQELRNNDTDL